MQLVAWEIYTSAAAADGVEYCFRWKDRGGLYVIRKFCFSHPFSLWTWT